MHLSIIIPAFNEERRIINTLNNMEHYLKKSSYEWEIIIVDDGSTDNTLQEVSRFQQKCASIRVLENGKNQGKGYSVKRGMLNAQGEQVLFSDADLSTPIEEIEKLLHAIDQGYDGAIGSRALPESQIELHQPRFREWMGKCFNRLAQSLVITGFQDTQCGFKCFKSHVVKKICPMMKISGFAFDVEMLFIAKKLGFKIKEVPVRWLDSPQSRVHPVRHSFQMFADMLQIRRNAIRGVYG